MTRNPNKGSIYKTFNEFTTYFTPHQRLQHRKKVNDDRDLDQQEKFSEPPLTFYFSINFFKFFNQFRYSLLSLFIIYSCKKFVVLPLIPRSSRYLWKAFCRFSSKSLYQKNYSNNIFHEIQYNKK